MLTTKTIRIARAMVECIRDDLINMPDVAKLAHLVEQAADTDPRIGADLKSVAGAYLRHDEGDREAAARLCRLVGDLDISHVGRPE